MLSDQSGGTIGHYSGLEFDIKEHIILVFHRIEQQLMIFEKQSQSLKPIAFISVVFSTFAVCSVLISFPLIINYIQTLESTVQIDLDFCKVHFHYFPMKIVNLLRKRKIYYFLDSSQRYVERIT